MLIDNSLTQSLRDAKRDSTSLNPPSCVVVKLFRDGKDLNQVVRMRLDERDILLNELKDMGYSNVVLLESKNKEAIDRLRYTTALGWYDDFLVVYQYGREFVDRFGKFVEIESVDLRGFDISDEYENKNRKKWRDYRIAKYGWYKENIGDGKGHFCIV